MKARICQLDPSPNNIIVNPAEHKLWCVDYELCAPFGAMEDVLISFSLTNAKEVEILKSALNTAGCSLRPAYIKDFKEDYSVWMTSVVIANLKKRSTVQAGLKRGINNSTDYIRRGINKAVRLMQKIPFISIVSRLKNL
jgi:hypothetical protein